MRGSTSEQPTQDFSWAVWIPCAESAARLELEQQLSERRVELADAETVARYVSDLFCLLDTMVGLSGQKEELLFEKKGLMPALQQLLIPLLKQSK